MTGKNFSDISYLLDPADRQAAHLPKTSYAGPEREPPIPRSEQAHESFIEVHEVVEHEPDSDVKDHVEVRQDQIQVTDDLKEMGVEADQSTQYPAYNKVQLPISDEKVLQGLHSPIHTSLRWLAEVCIFLLKQAHIRLKMAHGKAVRYFQA